MPQASSGVYHTLSEQEIAALHARNLADLEAAAALQNTAAALCPEEEKDDAAIPTEPQARQKYIALQQQSFALLYKVLCGEELLWYAHHDPAADTAENGAMDLCRPLRSFLNRVDFLTSDYLVIGEHSIPGWLYTAVQPERLIFVLLHQLLLLWQKDLTMNTMELFAEKTDAEIRIDLTLRCDPEAETEPLPSLLPRQPLLCDEAAELTARFCSLNHAKLMQHSAAGAVSCSIRIPAAGVLQPRLELHSDGCSVLTGNRNIYHAVLSALIPTEALLWGDAMVD
ncbi:MAG: hypothetical protein IKQ91_03320 [Oscillospiraceae bacterium]|nr:hypothetical protein [Oscillospiraceae bacterium]